MSSPNKMLPFGLPALLPNGSARNGTNRPSLPGLGLVAGGGNHPGLLSVNQILPSGPAARARGPLSGGRDGELGDDARRRNATDLAAGKLTEPDVAVGTERDRARQLLETRAVGGSSDRCGYRRSE